MAARQPAAKGFSPVPAVAAVVEPDDRSAGVVVECLLHPTNSWRRRRYPLATTLSQLASETEQALARPAKVVSISRRADKKGLPSAPLPLTADLRSLGATAGGYMILEVALRRTDEDGKELGEEDGARNAENPFLALRLVTRRQRTARRARRRLRMRRRPCRQRPSFTRRRKRAMEKPGLSIAQKHDKTMYPRPYFTADALDALKAEKAVIVQAHVRGFLARQKASKLRRAKQEIIDREEEEKAAAKREHEMRQKRLRNRCQHPETYADFAVLYQELESWRVQETARIKHTFVSDVHRRQAFKELLHRETDLLQHIEELKLQAMKESRKEKKLHFLETTARPFAWACPSTGDVITVFTPETMWAEELRKLYVDLENLAVDTATRLEILHRLQATVANAAPGRDQKRRLKTVSLNEEIVELCRREIDCLRRGTTQTAKLSGLRQRLSHAFWYLLQSPAFNPQAARYLKLPA
ncbi:putative IQ calmodulin-binding motif domain-containing protein [Neospora caninum Liverpool]|uniref:Putative IQ calmodulin-binding motif domain-containing protein n=1 Tax=Neospora caninum (strain Liverpool) TaxID=572307 RepID=F0VK18_NEOCL|nr:putative IQ calmodulin-binding motif domain-containing protein [Neospora caninum Liverpool]CBZ54419.1 putative IQ calmodulin-binding motif domain-containing protein [Neospora caninum Liverpool]|eukprot:XP_003884449.1 putative IQ calmodulin-binding motif domain-containing protein [Neospora caninum Liverpool]